MNTLVLLVYAVLIGIVSLRPGGGSSLDPWDKLLHFITYAVFAVLAYRAFREPRAFGLACLAIIVYGGLIEVAQSHMPGRFMSGYDFLANTLGVVAVALVLRQFGRAGARSQEKQAG